MLTTAPDSRAALRAALDRHTFDIGHAAEGRVHVQGDWTSVLTPAHLETVYGVSAVVGVAHGLPYVIPTTDHLRRSDSAD